MTIVADDLPSDSELRRGIDRYLAAVVSAATRHEERVIDAFFLSAALAKRRWLIVAVTLLFVGLCTTYAYLGTRVYRGSAVLIPASLDRTALNGGLMSTLGSVGTLASLAGVNLSDNDPQVQEALAVLQSRQFTENFIEKNNLMLKLFHGIWDQRSGTWKVPRDKQPTLGSAYREFNAIRSVKVDSKTGLITLNVDWPNRVEAAQWANGLVDALNAEMRGRAATDADASLGYLQRELMQTTDIGTREAVNRLIESQIQKRMLANVTKEYSLRFVDRALVPDADEPVRPRKLLLIVAGIVAGICAGVALALLLDLRERFKARA